MKAAPEERDYCYLLTALTLELLQLNYTQQQISAVMVLAEDMITAALEGRREVELKRQTS